MHLTAAEILETLMIISFGISWPTSIHKSYTARSTKGKSLLFLFFIFVGYLFGIAAKLLTNNLNLAFWFYILNSVMVFTDICLYFRNRRIQRREES
ncbi:MAG: hypothetical protein MR896_02495 [Clostridiales bacterium]|nr:hypothetical protein [Clostridiales bacterium]